MDTTHILLLQTIGALCPHCLNLKIPGFSNVHNMEHAQKAFPRGLPTLAELKDFNAGQDVPPETAWIWGDNDEV